MQEATNQPSHEQDRNKHGRQGDGHRDDGEAYFARALYGRLKGALAHLHVTHNVFQHHNGVIHHKAHGERERHQGKVIQAVAQHIHRRKCAHNRHGQGQAGNDGG